MSWVRIDDKIAFHKKIVKAGNEAVGAWLRMASWCAHHLTDGNVPADVALMIASGREEVVARLVAVGLLDMHGEDYAVHDYTDYNPTAEEVRTEREAASDRKANAGKAGGIASGVSRRSKRSRSEADAPKTGNENEAKRSPVPVPGFSLSGDPVPSSSVSDARARERALELGEPDSDKQRRIVDKHLSLALEILGELNAARSRVRPSSRGIRPTYSSLGGIAARLAAGRTLEECLLVVAAGEAECIRKPDAFDWFDAVSPWRPENFERRIAKDPGVQRGGITAPSAQFTEAGDKTAEYT